MKSITEQERQEYQDKGIDIESIDKQAQYPHYQVGQYVRFKGIESMPQYTANKVCKVVEQYDYNTYDIVHEDGQYSAKHETNIIRVLDSQIELYK